jgi:hypothetical protein
MRKLINQTAVQQELLATTTCDLQPAWVLQPTQGEFGRSTIGMDAETVDNPVIQWDFGSSSLTGLLFALYTERSALPMGQYLAAQTVDVTGEVLLSRGRYAFHVGHSPLYRVWLRVTAIGATRTFACIINTFGDFAPLRAPAGPNDWQGHGFDGYRPSPGVFATVPNRQPTAQALSGDTAAESPYLQSPKADRFIDFGEVP